MAVLNRYAKRMKEVLISIVIVSVVALGYLYVYPLVVYYIETSRTDPKMDDFRMPPPPPQTHPDVVFVHITRDSQLRIAQRFDDSDLLIEEQTIPVGDFHGFLRELLATHDVSGTVLTVDISTEQETLGDDYISIMMALRDHHVISVKSTQLDELHSQQ